MYFWILAALVSFGACGARAQCRASGRFANELAPECRGYTTCIATGASSYQYDLVCPPGYLYNHFDSQCTNATAYRCLPPAHCSRLGSFPDPDSADCSTFVACIEGLSGLSARLVGCAPDSLFDPEQQFCVNRGQYICPAPATPAAPDTPATVPAAAEVTTAKPNSSSPTSNTAAASSITYIALFTILFGAKAL